MDGVTRECAGGAGRLGTKQMSVESTFRRWRRIIKEKEEKMVSSMKIRWRLTSPGVLGALMVVVRDLELGR